ncbi:hypothetical protein L7F22_055822 [Adiantum nelumboides]|nr:hypothetical protein [Adiantum nelumboides]
MAHGGYGKRRVAGRPPLSSAHAGNSSRGLSARHHKDSDKKAKIVSIKNQIRSVERVLRKALPWEVKDVQQKRLEILKRQAELHAHAELERKMTLRYRKVKFFERRKIERGIRRLERLQRAAADNLTEDLARQAADMAQKLGQLKEDLEYVRFFPKTEKYVSLFTGDDQTIVDQRNKLRGQIKANLAAAAAAGVEPEETGSEDDGTLDVSEDEFFLAGSSSDDADADDEWTDMSSRPGDERDDTSKEVASSSRRNASRSREQLQHQRLSNLGKAPAQVDDIAEIQAFSQVQRQSSARELMPPPRDQSYVSSSNNGGSDSKSHPSSSRSSKMVMSESTSNQGTDQGGTGNPSSSTSWDVTKATALAVHSCNSDAQQKPRRKRTRPKKKKN